MLSRKAYISRSVKISGARLFKHVPDAVHSRGCLCETIGFDCKCEQKDLVYAAIVVNERIAPGINLDHAMAHGLRDSAC